MMTDWDGRTERRAPLKDHRAPPDEAVDLKAIWTVLRELEMGMKLHMKEEELWRPKLNEVLTIMERSKGVFLFLKLLIYVGTPVGALFYWIKDHVKF